jgi:hypothetical protein
MMLVSGRAQFVAHIGQELALHRRGGLGLGLSQAQLGLQRLAGRDVADDVGQAREAPGDRIGDQGRLAFQPKLGAGLVPSAEFHRPGRELALRGENRLAHVQDLLPLLGFHQRDESPAPPAPPG